MRAARSFEPLGFATCASNANANVKLHIVTLLFIKFVENTGLLGKFII